MRLAVHCSIAAALAIGGSVSSGAQASPRPFLDLQPGSMSTAGGTSSGLGIAPGLAWQSARTAGWLRGSGDVGAHATQLRDLDAQARSTLLRVGRLDLAAGGRLQYDRMPDGLSYGQLHADLRLGTGGPARGVSAGVGLRAGSAPGWRFAAASARFGGWMRALGVSMSGEITAGQLPVLADSGRPPTSGDRGGVFSPDSTPGTPGIPGSGGGYSRRANGFASEARLAMTTRVAGMDLDGVGGMYFFDRAITRGYGSVTMTRWLSTRFAAIAGAGLRSIDPGSGATRAVAMFGVRVAPGRVRRRLVDPPPAASTSLSVARQGDQVTIELHAPGAESVELSGDFTHWNTIVLERRSGDHWAVTLPLEPGVYRMNVRVDGGEWLPPPGASRMMDAYEGVVGVVVVN